MFEEWKKKQKNEKMNDDDRNLSNWQWERENYHCKIYVRKNEFFYLTFVFFFWQTNEEDEWWMMNDESKKMMMMRK